jgi:1,5-anhydro-D-fructose reductase (1,5-anhydro-D-mannitol-forming)
MSDLKFGLIGASYVAASRMVPAFHATGVTPTALFDTHQERFKYWREHDLDLITSDLDELLSSDINAVYISSRNEQHAPHAIAAAKAGKHVIVEKPMALTLAEARATVAAAGSVRRPTCG